MPTYTLYISLECLELNFETHKNLLKQKVDFEKFELGKFFKTHKIR